jgi:hypothetical protein
MSSDITSASVAKIARREPDNQRSQAEDGSRRHPDPPKRSYIPQKRWREELQFGAAFRTDVERLARKEAARAALRIGRVTAKLSLKTR